MGPRPIPGNHRIYFGNIVQIYPHMSSEVCVPDLLSFNGHNTGRSYRNTDPFINFPHFGNCNLGQLPSTILRNLEAALSAFGFASPGTEALVSRKYRLRPQTKPSPKSNER